jgi:molybdopterin molybdotransferase
MDNKHDMIYLEDAVSIIHQHRIDKMAEEVDLKSAYGRILAENVHSDRDLPPFNKAAMDGFACKRIDLGKTLLINESVPAGAVPQMSVIPGTCTKIMTGAKVPDGADCVIKQEETTLESDGSVTYSGTGTSNNICYKGEDVSSGSVVLKSGTLLRPQDIGILASVGRQRIRVITPLIVGVLSTGSELVEPGEVPGETSIYNSNSWQLLAQIASTGCTSVYYGIVQDDANEIFSKIEEMINQCDVIVLTGGASVGEYDLVNEVVGKLGFSVEFQKLAIQPGKPVSFGHKRDKVCFGLSGNPVSCFLQFELLVKPFLLSEATGGFKPLEYQLKMSEPFKRKKTERKYFLPVKTNKGQVTPLNYHGSAHLTALTDLDGFAVIPIGVGQINKGEEVYVRFI